MKTEHILVMRFSAMGDVAMTVPVIYSLAKLYPHLRITVISRPFAKIFFENLAPNIGFMEADLKNEYHGVKGLNELYKRLKAKKFTAVADLHDVLRTKYLRMRFAMERIPVNHINKHRNGKKLLVQQNNKVLKQQPTAFANYAEVFDKLGYPVKVNFKSIFGNTKPALRQLAVPCNDKKPLQQWIGMAPFAAHKGKIYPLRQTELVIQQLIKKHPSCRIFLMGGGQEEKQKLDEIAAKYKECINASSTLSSLKEELILMSHLDVMVSMDSANMHLASLTGTPVVSIWGATHPYAGFMGWNQNSENAIQINLPCRPCSIYGNKPCLRGDYACLKNITPELIVNRIEFVLRK